MVSQIQTLFVANYKKQYREQKPDNSMKGTNRIKLIRVSRPTVFAKQNNKIIWSN